MKTSKDKRGYLQVSVFVCGLIILTLSFIWLLYGVYQMLFVWHSPDEMLSVFTSRYIIPSIIGYVLSEILMHFAVWWR